MAILCPRCRAALPAVDGACSSCGRPAVLSDGAVLFHPEVAGDHADYDAGRHQRLREVEAAHFWFVTRRRVIAGMFERHVASSARVIEIGAGTGGNARMLQDLGYGNLAVGELHSSGVRLAEEYGIRERYQLDLLRNPFVEEFDAVALFDVIEHIEEDAAAAGELHRMLRPGGHALFTVPAHMWLWSAHDVRARHKRRYTKRTFRALLQGAGFELLELRHFFSALLPMLLLRHWRHDPDVPVEPGGHEPDFHPPAALNTAARIVLGIDASIARAVPLPAGGSMWAVARKPG